MHTSILDCIVVGAGPSGLSASLFLARYRLSSLTFHFSAPRNQYSHGVHGFLGHDGILPHNLLQRGREEVEKYGGTLREGCVTTAKCLENGNLAVEVLEDNELKHYESRKLILATGLRDFTPDCPGFREFYGQSVHHCPDCDAFEHRDKHIVVLGHGKRVVGFALSLLTWTDRLTVVSNGEPLEEDLLARLRQHNIQHDLRRITSLEGDVPRGELQQVRFSDGSTLPCDALFFTLGTQPSSDLYAQLNCRMDDECGLVWVDAHQQTSTPNVYAVGDLTPHSQLAVVAAAEGAMAAIHIHKSLQPSDRFL